ncbi:hypothetical protein B0T17DRAFT_525156 [Bombardia bombarda]|uniref:Uncharacterized protein n=1 Tax=Bombardia bombarda TaxID=252184 RepID=A0AA39X8K4_9PEZI|nr:hypothetical protein B0T17DRAFT_525156 [Bombardia bombarda]
MFRNMASKEQSIIGRLSDFFWILATSIGKLNLRGGMMVEMVAACLDDRRRSLDSASLSDAGKDYNQPVAFPVLFDRIHVSNISDYVGGLFSVLLYARPLLKVQGELTFASPFSSTRPSSPPTTTSKPSTWVFRPRG